MWPHLPLSLLLPAQMRSRLPEGPTLRTAALCPRAPQGPCKMLSRAPFFMERKGLGGAGMS